MIADIIVFQDVSEIRVFMPEDGFWSPESSLTMSSCLSFVFFQLFSRKATWFFLDFYIESNVTRLFYFSPAQK